MSAAGAAHGDVPVVPERVFVLGAGRAGRSLASALAAAGAELVGLHGRRAAAVAPPLPAPTVGALPAALARASVVLVTVRDGQLDEALGELATAADAGLLAADAVILHASGAIDPAALAPLRARGFAGGTFHPLLPLHEPSRAAALLRGAWVGVDGDARARHAARRLAAAIGAHTLEIPAGGKARYHAAAVLASNFPVVLAGLAARLLRDAGVTGEAADGAVRALLRGAVDNLAASPLDGVALAGVLTGPVSRGDVESVRRHVAALREDADAAAVYAALTRAAVALLRDGGRDAPALAAVEALLRTDGTT